MKLILPILALAFLAGCSGKESAPVATPTASSGNAFTEKLKSLPESERAEYARTHPEEAMASAGVSTPQAPAPAGQ